MLTRGNRKLGLKHIWGFTLPSGTDAVCPGRTSICARSCYALRLEKLRPKVHKAYQRNLVMTKRRDFAQRMYYFVRAMRIRTVRIHIGGDFFSEEYARKWLQVIEKSPRTHFYFYTRSWRISPICVVLEEMASLPNCSAWYSCDSETGLPANVPPRVRLAWLQLDPLEQINSPVHLIFRDYPLRKHPVTHSSDAHICPEQDGLRRKQRITSESCQFCFMPRVSSHSKRVPLGMLNDSGKL
ncbi:MAG: hypothetical protein JNJ77_16590 [Planctomycetia bacterium]|nr:hypothetical protein [Planctomycetia bacterium]